MTQPPEPETAVVRLCIAAGLDVVVLSNDEALVQFGSRSHPSELFRDSEMTGVLGRVMVRLLEGPATLEELLTTGGSAHDADVRTFVDTLAKKGILVSESADTVAQYLGHATGTSADLSRHAVAVIGCGPLGARVASGLAQHGIGPILLSDDRPIDNHWRRFAPPGLERWLEGTGPASGAVYEWLAGAGHPVELIESPLEVAGFEAVTSKADLTILALEQVDLRLAHLLNRHAVRTSHPWLHALVDGNVGVVGPLFRTPGTACYNEFQTLRSAATPSPAMMNRYRSHVLARGRASFFAGLPAYADLVAGYTVLATVQYLLSGTNFAVGRAMFLNFEQMVIDTDDVLRLPRCPVCGANRRPGRPLLGPQGSSVGAAPTGEAGALPHSGERAAAGQTTAGHSPSHPSG